MKSTIFLKVLDSTVIKVDTPIDETIKKLRAQQGSARERDNDKNELGFFCTKKGNITVAHANNGKLNRRIFFIKGKVYEQDGKTFVELCYVRDRLGFISLIIALVLSFIIIGAYITIKTVLDYPLGAKGCLLIAYMLISIAAFVISMKKTSKNKTADFEIMKNLAINRIEAIKRWDD